jgi:predicted DNA-binding transcriptional regulator YafY
LDKLGRFEIGSGDNHMARGDQLGRQWKIIQTLLSSQIGKSAAELAVELGCHSRTVYRDLEALQIAGFPLYTERVNHNSRWSLLSSAKRQIPIPLDITELMALYFSRNMMKFLKNTVFYDSLETFFQKIKTTLPPEYLKYLNRIEESLEVGPKPYKPYGQFRQIIDRVNESVIQRRFVQMIYYSMSRKVASRRKVAPYKVWFFDGTFYMIGYCRLRKDVRIFALDRIQQLETTEESFEIPENIDLDAFMKASFGVFHGIPVHVKIWFSSDIAGYITEKIWHETQKIESQEDGSILFTAEVAGTEEIKFWILNWGSKAVVIEPESLREDIRSEASAMLQRYGIKEGNQ